MGWFFKKAVLEPGEHIIATKMANRTQGSRAMGGLITVTDRRLVFRPNIIAWLLGGRSWSVGRDEVVGVGVAPRSSKGGPFSGGIRERLRVRAKDGGEELFVVNGLDGFLGQLAEAGLHRLPA